MNTREKWKNQHWGGKARELSGTRRGVPGLLGGGWRYTRVTCAHSSVAGMVSQGVFVGWQGFHSCCNQSWNATGGSLHKFSHCCSQFFMGAPALCSDSQVQRTLETSIVFLQTITVSSSIVPSPTCPTFYFCLHVCFSIFPFRLQFLSFLFSPSLRQYHQFPVSHLVLGFVHSPTSLSLRPTSATLPRIYVSPSCSLGTNRTLSKPSKDMYALALCFCARCQSGLHTAGKGSRAQPSVAGGQSRKQWQIDAFIGMSLVAGAWTGVVFPPRALIQTDLGIIYSAAKVHNIASRVNLYWTGALWSFSWMYRVGQGHEKQLLSPNCFFQLNNSSCLDIIFNQKFSSK